MSISITCPRCERVYTLADTQEGKTIRCKDCDEKLVVEKPRRRRSSDEDEDRRPQQRSARHREDDEDRRPRRRSKKGGIPVWVWLVTGGGLVLLIVGVVVLVVVMGKKEGDPGGKGPEGAGKTDVGGGNLTLDKFRKLKTGMSEAEIQAIFGTPRSRNRGGDGFDQVYWMEGPQDRPTLSLQTTFKNSKLFAAQLIRLNYGREAMINDHEVSLATLNPEGYIGTAADSSKLTEANFNRIERGMTENQVIAIFGPPTQRHGDSEKTESQTLHVLIWMNGKKAIRVDFKNGRVHTKQKAD